VIRWKEPRLWGRDDTKIGSIENVGHAYANQDARRKLVFAICRTMRLAAFYGKMGNDYYPDVAVVEYVTNLADYRTALHRKFRSKGATKI